MPDDFKFFMDLYPQEDAAVLKENAKKHTANVINVQFIPAANFKEPMPASNSIVINEETGEIVTLMDLSLWMGSEEASCSKKLRN